SSSPSGPSCGRRRSYSGVRLAGMTPSLAREGGWTPCRSGLRLIPAIQDEVEVAGRVAEVGQHGGDLAPMLGAVIRAMNHRLPARKPHRAPVARPEDRVAERTVVQRGDVLAPPRVELLALPAHDLERRKLCGRKGRRRLFPP